MLDRLLSLRDSGESRKQDLLERDNAPTRLSGILQEGRLTITPAMASQIIGKFNYRSQRQVDDQHVAALATLMTKGLFTAGSQIAFGVLPDQSVHLVNGQHRLMAVAKSGVPLEFQILLVPCGDETALHALYYRFDTTQRTRTGATIVKSTGIAEKLNLQNRFAVQAYSAGIIIASGLKHVQASNRDPMHRTPDGRLSAIEPWWDQVKQYNDLLSRTQSELKQRLTNASVMAVALVTLHHQPRKATEFWKGVAENDGLRKGDPRHSFVDAVLTRNFRNSPNEALYLAAGAWNGFYQNRSITYLKPGSAKGCFPLGTPFAAQRKGA